MRNLKYLGILPLLALVLVACASSTGTSTTGTAATSTPLSLGYTATSAAGSQATEAPGMETATPRATTQAATESTTGAGTAVGTQASNGTASTDTANDSIPVTGGGTLNVRETREHGPILVDNQGRALYVFMNDTQNSGASTCEGDCATAWPPLITDGPATPGNGMDAMLLSTLPRGDGSTQVTYNGWPLYLYQGDNGTNDVNGQGVNAFGGYWYLISPTGEPIQR